MLNTVKPVVLWRNTPLHDLELSELQSAKNAFEASIDLHDLQLDQDNLNDHQVTALYKARVSDKNALDIINREIAQRTHEALTVTVSSE